MNLNDKILDILEEFKIDKEEGIFCLLGFFYELDVEKIILGDTLKAINLTKIVEKDYNTGTIKWNIPLFTGQETAFDWVEDWIKPFGKMNPERKGVKKDCISRMKKFFADNPEYRKEDIYKARDLYLSTVKDPQYLKSPHKFIYEGTGAYKSSALLQWCEKIKENSSNNNLNNNLKGLIK